MVFDLDYQGTNSGSGWLEQSMFDQVDASGYLQNFTNYWRPKAGEIPLFEGDFAKPWGRGQSFTDCNIVTGCPRL